MAEKPRSNPQCGSNANVSFRRRAVEGWPEKTQAAQEISCYTLNGGPVQRIRYGDEHSDWQADKFPCHDCSVLKGEFHVPTCDIEECPECGGQLVSCECPFDDLPEAG